MVKTEVKKIDNTKREISIEVSGDIVKNKFEAVFGKFAKDAKVPGFRPGHVPHDILEKHFSAAIHEQVLKELVPEVYSDAIEKEKLDVVELPEISEVKLDRVSLSFKAMVEVMPEILIKNYKGIKVNYKNIEVKPEQARQSIDSLKEARKIEKIDEGFARSLGYPSLQELEKAIERQIFIQKENQQRQNIENGIINSLTKDLDFKIPASLINRQLQDLVRQAKVELALRGMPAEKIAEQEKELLTKLEPEAKKQVKVYLVLAEIAKKENIAFDYNMPRWVMEFLLKEANWVVSSG
jgi:FKBP-type peptidyl-prolyl cis-trans isomerase (trigger factor)